MNQSQARGPPLDKGEGRERPNFPETDRSLPPDRTDAEATIERRGHAFMLLARARSASVKTVNPFGEKRDDAYEEAV